MQKAVDNSESSVKFALRRFLSVEKSPEWPTLPQVVQVVTHAGTALCHFTLGDREACDNALERLNRELEDIEDNTQTLNTVLGNCARMGEGFARAGFTETTRLAIRIIESKRAALKSKFAGRDLQQSYWIASLAKKIGDLESASAAFERARDTATDLGEETLLGGISFHLGEAYLKMGLKEKAVSGFQECLKRIPDHRKAREYLEQLGEGDVE